MTSVLHLMSHFCACGWQRWALWLYSAVGALPASSPLCLNPCLCSVHRRHKELGFVSSVAYEHSLTYPMVKEPAAALQNAKRRFAATSA